MDTTNLFDKICRILIFIIAITILGCGIFTCTNKTVKNKKEEKVIVAKPIEDVLKEHTQELMSIQGVAGIGQGLHNEKSCIKVFVTKISPDLKNKIPGILDGYPVIIEETGPFKTF